MISMLSVLGWLYSVAPVRLCTSYLQSDQEQLGRVLYVLAGVLALAWALPWMFGSNNAAVEAPSLRYPKRAEARARGDNGCRA